MYLCSQPSQVKAGTPYSSNWTLYPLSNPPSEILAEIRFCWTRYLLLPVVTPQSVYVLSYWTLLYVLPTYQ